MQSLADQAYAITIIILGGAALGLLFDWYRVLRGLCKPGKAITWITDCLFWLLVTPIALFFLLVANWGELRLYSLVGLLLGLVLYWWLLSKIVISVLLTVFNALWRFTLSIGRLVIFLVTLVPRLIYALFSGRLIVFRRPRWLRGFCGRFRFSLPKARFRLPKLFRIRV